MPRPNDNVRCGTCQAWVDGNGHVSPRLGNCHMNAPTDAGGSNDWPVTPENSWCMQWTPLGAPMPHETRPDLPSAPRGRAIDLSD